VKTIFCLFVFLFFGVCTKAQVFPSNQRRTRPVERGGERRMGAPILQARVVSHNFDTQCYVDIVEVESGLLRTTFKPRLCSTNAFMPLPSMQVEKLEGIIVEYQLMIDAFHVAYPTLHISNIQIDAALKGVWFFYEPNMMQQ